MMYIQKMRMRHEWKAIQTGKRVVGAFAGRAFHCSWSVWATSRVQYRIGFEKSEYVGCSNADSLVGAARKEIEGTANDAQGIRSSRSEGEESFAMSRKSRSYEQAFAVSPNIPVKLIECPERELEFRERVELVQSLIAEMIVLGRKRGRPAQKEESYEKAA